MTATPESLHLRAVAGRIVDAALLRIPLRAALLVGSAPRGDSDLFSDVDLILYVDELPTDVTLIEIRTAVGGRQPRSPLQKAFTGVLEGIALHGADLIEKWRNRLRDYPESLRRAMIERHWTFVPLWHHTDSMAARDCELWRREALLEASFNLLAVLSGLNRLYFSRFQLTRLRKLTRQMSLSPPNLADRLESLFELPPAQAADELGQLVTETRELVSADLPDPDLPMRFPPGTRQRPWRIGEV